MSIEDKPIWFSQMEKMFNPSEKTTKEVNLDAAKALMGLYRSYIAVGFSKKEALELTKTSMELGLRMNGYIK